MEKSIMSAIDKLNKARHLLERLIDDLIVSLSINIDFKRLHILLKDGVESYIAYNNYDEYSYSIIFSKEISNYNKFLLRFQFIPAYLKVN